MLGRSRFRDGTSHRTKNGPKEEGMVCRVFYEDLDHIEAKLEVKSSQIGWVVGCDMESVKPSEGSKLRFQSLTHGKLLEQ